MRSKSEITRGTAAIYSIENLGFPNYDRPLQTPSPHEVIGIEHGTCYNPSGVVMSIIKDPPTFGYLILVSSIAHVRHNPLVHGSSLALLINEVNEGFLNLGQGIEDQLTEHTTPDRMSPPAKEND